MTPQEQQMIDGLISRIRSTQVEHKDVAAEQHLQSGLAGVPDVLYILAQTVLVQQYGLEQAQAQNDSLKQQVQSLQQAQPQESSSGGGSFLSHLFGGGSNNSNPTPQQRSDNAYQPVNYPPNPQTAYPAPPPPPYGQPSYGQPGYPAQGGGMFGGGGGGFLRGAMQTAAGVAAGEVMFRGMEDLFSGFGGERGRGFAGPGGGGETIINNYGDDAAAPRFGESNTRDDSNFYNPGDDASRQNFGDSGNFDNSTSDLDSNTNDFANNDDSGSDDAGSFDDSGSDDFSNDDNS